MPCKHCITVLHTSTVNIMLNNVPLLLYISILLICCLICCLPVPFNNLCKNCTCFHLQTVRRLFKMPKTARKVATPGSGGPQTPGSAKKRKTAAAGRPKKKNRVTRTGIRNIFGTKYTKNSLAMTVPVS